MQPKDRKTQVIVLLLSLAVIIWGLFDLFTGNFDDFIKVSGTGGRNTSILILFLIAIVMAFFSAKNLLTGKKE